jgi:hypothetical protein
MLGNVPGKAAVAAKTTTTKSSSAPKGSRAFNAAFRAARKAGRDEFSFGGKRFNTKLAPTKTTTTTTKAVAAKPAAQVSLNRQGRLEPAMGTNARGQRVPATGDVKDRAKARTFFDRAPATPEARERARKALDRGGDFKARSEATFRRSLAEGVLGAVGGPALGAVGKAAGVASKAGAGVRSLFAAGLNKPATTAATKVAATTATKAAPAATKTVSKTVAAKAAPAPAPRPTQAIPTREAPALSTRARLNTSTAAPRPAATTTPTIRNLPGRTPEVTKTTRLEGTKTVTRGGERAVPKAEMKAALKAEKVADKAALAGSGKSPAEIVAAARSRGMMPAKSVAKANVVGKLAEVTPGTSTRAVLRSGTAGPAPGAPAAAVRSGAASEAAAKKSADALANKVNAEASRRASVQSTWTRRQAERSRAEVNSYKGPDAKAEAPTKRTRAPNKPKVDTAAVVVKTTKTPRQGALNL